MVAVRDRKCMFSIAMVVLASLPIQNISATEALPLSAEKFSAPLPSNYKLTDTIVNGNEYSKFYFSIDGENREHMSEIIISRFDGVWWGIDAPGALSAAFVDEFAAEMKKECSISERGHFMPNVPVAADHLPILKGQAGGYRKALFSIRCLNSSKKLLSDTMLVAYQGVSNLYMVRFIYFVDPTGEQEQFRLAFLKGVKLCGPKTTIEPC